jgi:hypothetical protein
VEVADIVPRKQIGAPEPTTTAVIFSQNLWDRRDMAGLRFFGRGIFERARAMAMKTPASTALPASVPVFVISKKV